jgi:Terminase RNaseH-like domain/Terminase large subunit, T4likevirus-type, N-terminal
MIESSYRANPLLKAEGVKIDFSQEQVEEYIKCAQDPLYFIQNYVKVVHVDHGVIPFNMWDFQKDMISTFHENRFSIVKCPRQVGKTVSSVAYILWMSVFNADQNIAILANKGDLAQEILDRYQLAYENLPMWLQQGVRVWNKRSVELENGSKVLASATSSNAIRGGSFTCVFLDEFAFVPPNIAEGFFTSVYPVISSGKSTKMIIVSTPNGMNLFYKMWTDSVAGRSEYKNFSIHWSMVPGRDEQFKEQTIKNTSLRQWNQEFETEFLGSTNTLVSAEKLATLAYKNPVSRYSDTVIYEEPVKDAFDDETGEQISKDNTYVITVDVSEGKNLDYSAFNVINISTMPYRQVAVYRNNAIPPMLFPTIIKAVAEYYNNAFVLIEINNTPQVADLLLEDLEYDNVLQVSSGNKRAQTVTINRGSKNVARGVKMSPLVKRMGCSTIKTLIENDKIIINDFETISEFTTFVINGPSFAAEEGCNDDLVMSFVIFGWLATQKFFKEMVEFDVRKQLQMEHFNYVEEEQLPLGEISNGKEIAHFVEDGAVWVESNYSDPYGEVLKSLLDF